MDCATINVPSVYINPVPTGMDKNLRDSCTYTVNYIYCQAHSKIHSYHMLSNLSTCKHSHINQLIQMISFPLIT